MNALAQNLKFAARQLRRNPGFTATVIITLALSIGANTAIFSILNALLLKSLPYSHPERMGTIYMQLLGSGAFDERHNLDGEQWELLRDNVPALISAISSPRTSGLNLGWGSQGLYLHAGRVSAHYFDVLATQPFLGRNFTDDEDRPRGPKAAILSYTLWRNAFHSNAQILGRTILLKGEPYTIIGVLPQDSTTPSNADLYIALQAGRDGEGRGTNFATIIRLRDGATWQEADAQINRAWALRSGRYELKDHPGAQIIYHSVPLQKGLTASLRPQVMGLMLSAGFILLIACANIAGLTLVRMLRRTSEIATRLSLGASSWQIQKQFWVENLLLGLLGGVAGVGVGFVALRGLLLLLPEHFLPVAQVSLDSRVLSFAVCVSIFTSVLFGMLPVLTARRVDLRSSMATRGIARGGSVVLRQLLIAGEVALTVVLLAASGLLIRTLVHLETLPKGFNPDGLMTAKASLDDVRFHDPAAFQKLLEQSTAAMLRIPGVQNAAVGQSLPYERSVIDGSLEISDGKEAGEHGKTYQVYITPGYFETLQIPLVLGRSFTEADRSNTERVAIVNRAFMRRTFHGENPVGRHVDKNAMIVGVVEDVPVARGLDDVAPLAGEPTLYVPATQVDAQSLALSHMWFQPSWIVRTSTQGSGTMDEITALMQRSLASVDPGLPFSGFYSMRDLLVKTLATQRVEVALLGSMAALALLLSAVGIFSLVANLVAQRTREIGIRMALGSTVGRAMAHVGRSGAGASAIGLLLGLILCGGVLGAMRSVVYGVAVYDTATISSVVLLLLLVTLVAVFVPALRIARIDPARTLREE